MSAASLPLLSHSSDGESGKNSLNSSMDTVEHKHVQLTAQQQPPITLVPSVLQKLNVIEKLKNKVKLLKREQSTNFHGLLSQYNVSDDLCENVSTNASSTLNNTFIANKNTDGLDIRSTSSAVVQAVDEQKEKKQADLTVSNNYNSLTTSCKDPCPRSVIQVTPTSTMATLTAQSVEVSAHHDSVRSLSDSTVSTTMAPIKHLSIDRCPSSFICHTESSSSASSSLLSSSVFSFQTQASKHIKLFGRHFARRKEKCSIKNSGIRHNKTVEAPSQCFATNDNSPVSIFDQGTFVMDKEKRLSIRHDMLAFQVPENWARIQPRNNNYRREDSYKHIIPIYNSTSGIVDYMNTLLEHVDLLSKQINQNKLSIQEYKTKLRDMDDAILELLELTRNRKGEVQYLQRLSLEVEQRQLLKQKHLEHKGLYLKNGILRDMATDRLEQLQLKVQLMHESELKRQRWILYPFVAFFGIAVAILGFLEIT